ncbi:hypothetical protein FYJ43_00805 [Cutibacterium sp. WCA-380-WT-3A]|uniref:Glycoprotein n=2 Tax=Cutibacterium porci TaxID=2605781 RepID=A0A7K0J3Y0_9ACTN|nr:hypothetical protein [Cutibacterium porci]
MVLATVLAESSPAQARTTSELLKVTITSVTPPTGDPKTPITIRGTVTNTSSVSMTWVQASFWRSQDEINDTRDLSDLLAAPTTVPVGMRWYKEPKEASISNITDPEANQTFKPGDTGSFTVTGTPAQMGMTSPNAVYAVGVHVQATPGNQARRTVGRARVLTVLSDTHTSANLTPVIVLSAPPSRRIDGSFTDESLSDDIVERLIPLAEAAHTRDATVLVDPSLIDDARAMAAGYVVGGKDSHTVTGTGQERAKEWLSLVEPLLSSGRAYRLPYGNADVVGIVRQGRSGLLTSVKHAVDPSNPAAHLPLAIIDPAAELDDPSFKTLAKELSPSIVLTCAAATPNGVREESGVKIIGLTDMVRTGGHPQSSSDSQRRGILLSQALLMTRDSIPAVTLVTTMDDIQATAPVGWLHLRNLSTILSGAKPGLHLSESRGGNTVLKNSWWQVQHDVGVDADGWSDLVGASPEMASLTSAKFVSRALSSSLKDREAWAADVMRPATQVIAGNGLVLHSASQFVMSSSRNDFPLTVTNSLAQPVRVKVVVTSENPQRIDIPDTQVVVIQPKETQTIRFAPKASSNGVVEMQAHLSTPSGRLLGSQTRFVVKATQMDDVGWIIIVVSALVLVIATVLRIRQVAASSGPDADAPDAQAPATKVDDISADSPVSTAQQGHNTAARDDSAPGSPADTDDPTV